MYSIGLCARGSCMRERESESAHVTYCCRLLSVQERMEDPFMAQYYSGLFPRDNPRNTRCLSALAFSAHLSASLSG